MKLSVLSILSSLLSVSCVHYSPVTRESVKESGGIRNTPSAVGKGVRTRALVLPLKDESTYVPQAVVDDIFLTWLDKLEQQSDLIVVRQSDMKLPGQTIREISQAASQSGIPILIEPKILEIQARGKVDPIGVIRRAQSELIIRLQLQVYASKSGSETYNKIKTVTIEDSQVRIGESTQSNQFVTGNPNLVRRRILESFQDYIPELQMLLAKFAWEGRVALVQGDRIYLNVGKLTGLKVGDILRVSDIGDEIYDPQSGQFIGRTPGRVKGTVEIISYFGEDGSISALHSGSGFKENDRVELHW